MTLSLGASSTTISQGQGVTISFTISGGLPLYYWYWVDSHGNGSGTMEIANAGNSASFTATPGVTTTYSVVAQDFYGDSAGGQETITVLSAPTFTTEPVGLAVGAPTGFTLRAAATGSPAPTYQWSLNGTVLPGATSASYTVSSSTAASGGTYTVTATNSQGSLTSSPALVAVASEVPIVSQAPSSRAAPLGAAVTLASSGYTPTGYQWCLNGVPIPGATSSQYSVPSAQAANAGTYTCVVANDRGSTTSQPAVLSVH